MKVIAISISDEDAEELLVLTGKSNLEAAINASIRFALMYDEDIIQETLKL